MPQEFFGLESLSHQQLEGLFVASAILNVMLAFYLAGTVWKVTQNKGVI